MQLYGADPARIEVVPCGVEPQEFPRIDRRAARRELGWNPEEFSVLQLGRLVPRKGIDNVIRAIGLLRDRHGISARLYIVGGNSGLPNEMATPEISRLRAVAREAGVESQLQFAGRRARAELSRYYCASDVFVTTPWYEPFGITPLEAMACGVPVIGSGVGGIRDSVDHGRSGYLVPPKNPEALASRLAELAVDRGLRQRMGDEGRRRAMRHFTWQRVAARMEQVYLGLLGESAAAAAVPAGAA
jgi:glycosyltransferase involved in cell wall biosynthesis